MTPLERLKKLIANRARRSTYSKQIEAIANTIQMPAAITEVTYTKEGFMYRIYINGEPFGGLILTLKSADVISEWLQENKHKLSINAPLDPNNQSR